VLKVTLRVATLGAESAVMEMQYMTSLFFFVVHCSVEMLVMVMVCRQKNLQEENIIYCQQLRDMLGVALAMQMSSVSCGNLSCIRQESSGLDCYLLVT